MDNEIAKSPINTVSANSQQPQVLLQQTAEKITNIDSANTVNNVVNIINVSPDNPAPILQRQISGNFILSGGRQMCTDYYNVCVTNEVDFYSQDLNKDFLVDKTRAITGFTEEDLRRRYSTLTPDAIRDLCTFPTIFANENHEYGYTDDDQMLALGFIKSVRKEQSGIRIIPDIHYYLPQQVINENFERLCMGGHEHLNELNNSHWAVKQLDLIAELEDIGFIFNTNDTRS